MKWTECCRRCREVLIKRNQQTGPLMNPHVLLGIGATRLPSSRWCRDTDCIERGSWCRSRVISNSPAERTCFSFSLLNCFIQSQSRSLHRPVCVETSRSASQQNQTCFFVKLMSVRSFVLHLIIIIIIVASVHQQPSPDFQTLQGRFLTCLFGVRRSALIVILPRRQRQRSAAVTSYLAALLSWEDRGAGWDRRLCGNNHLSPPVA